MNLGRPLMPDLAVLQAFECAARHGSFTQAAVELNLTQSAVSRQIKDSGSHIWACCCSSGSASASCFRLRAGSFCRKCRRLLQQSEEMILRAMASADGKSVLSIATLPTFGSRWLMPRLPDFLDRHPGIAVNIASRSEPFDFSDEDFDLAIHYGQPIWARATCTYLCSEIIVPVASPHCWKLIRSVSRVTWKTNPCCILRQDRKLWVEWFERNGVGWETAYHGNRFDQFSMIIEAAVARPRLRASAALSDRGGDRHRPAADRLRQTDDDRQPLLCRPARGKAGQCAGARISVLASRQGCYEHLPGRSGKATLNTRPDEMGVPVGLMDGCMWVMPDRRAYPLRASRWKVDFRSKASSIPVPFMATASGEPGIGERGRPFIPGTGAACPASAVQGARRRCRRRRERQDPGPAGMGLCRYGERSGHDGGHSHADLLHQQAVHLRRASGRGGRPCPS